MSNMYKNFKLKDIAILNSKTLKKSEMFKTILYLDTSNLTKGKFNKFQELDCNKDKIPSRAKRRVKNNTILYSTVRPNQLHYGIIDNPPENLIVSTGYTTIDVNENLFDPYYVYLNITNKYNTEYLSQIANTSTSSYPSITPDDIGNIEIKIPIDQNGNVDLLQQKYIAGKIRSLTKKMNNNDTICKLTTELILTIFNYWFLQYEFPNEQNVSYKTNGGKFIYNDELKIDIPIGWEVLKIKECIKSIKTGLNPRQNFKLNNGNIKYITVKNLTTSGNIDFSTCDTINQEAKSIISKRSNVEIGDILFASIAPLGRCHLVEKEPLSWEINESVFSIKPNHKKITSEYLYLYLTSDFFINQAEHNSTGSIFSGIRITTLEDLYILVPPKKILEQFNSYVKKLFYDRDILFDETIELESLFDYILPELINGKISF